jgi:hypothetical protein
MARLGTRQQIFLLVTAASVPVSLGITAWPPAHVHEIVVVQVPVEAVAAPAEAVVAPPVEPVRAEPAAPELVEASAQPAGFVYGRDFLWVTHDVEGHSPFVVLSLEPDPAWAKGPVEVGEDYSLVTRALAEDAVPAELRAMAGERVVVHGRGAPLCAATVGELRLVAQADGDLAMLLDDEHFESSDDFWTRPEAEQRALVAEPTWEEGRRLLVAPLQLDEGCRGAEPRWARPLWRGDVERLEAQRLRKRPGLVREFLALPELVELSQEFDDYVASMHQAALEEAARSEAPAAEPATEPTAGPAVDLTAEPAGDLTAEPAAAPELPRLADRVKGEQWRTAEGEVAFVAMITEGEELMPEPCSGIPAPEWALAPVDADGDAGRFVVGPYGDPSAIFDLEGDGQWEVLISVDPYFSEPQLVTFTADGFSALTALPSVPHFGCPC